jgi:WD40 repeat protein
LGFTSFVFAQRNGTVSMSVKKRLLLRSYASHYAIIGYWRHFTSTPIGHDPTERTLVTLPTIHGERTVEMLPLGRRVNVTINDVLFDPSGVYIATGTSDGKISIYDFHQSLENSYASYLERLRRKRRDSAEGFPTPQTTDPLALLSSALLTMTSSSGVTKVEWMSNQRVCASLSGKSEVCVYDLETYQGAAAHTLMSSVRSSILDIAIPASSRLQSSQFVYAGLRDGSIRIWDTRAGSKPSKFLLDLEGRGATNSLRVSDDGQVLCSGGESGRVSLWDIRNEKVSLRSWNLTSAVASLTFHPEKRYEIAYQLRSSAYGLIDIRDTRVLFHCPATERDCSPNGRICFSRSPSLLHLPTPSGVRIIDMTLKMEDCAVSVPVDTGCVSVDVHPSLSYFVTSTGTRNVYVCGHIWGPESS